MAYLSPVQHAGVDFTDPKGGRLILYGTAFAGKTSLWKKLIRWCPHLSKSWPGSGLIDWVVPRRTRGIEIQLLQNDDTMDITIWDLAGQDKFRALQDHLFPTITQACILRSSSALRPSDAQAEAGLGQRAGKGPSALAPFYRV